MYVGRCITDKRQILCLLLDVLLIKADVCVFEVRYIADRETNRVYVDRLLTNKRQIRCMWIVVFLIRDP